MIVTTMDIIIILFLSYISGCLSTIAYFEYLTLELPMSDTLTITIPLTSTIDPAQLLEIAQALIEELENAINDAGSECDIDELDVSVSSK